MSAWTLRARWVFPVSAPPIPDGVVTIDGERIVAVEPAGTRSVDVDLGDVAILPGLVNAHTHLDLRGPTLSISRASTFPDWLRLVIKYRGNNNVLIAHRVRLGITDSIRAG